MLTLGIRFIGRNFTVVDEDEINEIMLVQSNIVGFNLIRFFKEHQDQLDGETYQIFQTYMHEGEIILLENLGIVLEISWFQYTRENKI